MDLPILSHIKELRANEKGHVVNADTNQDFVPPAIERLVVVAIDLE